jgi:hypothetical protein
MDYCCGDRRKSKNDKRAKARYNKFKRGGAMRCWKSKNKVEGKNKE